MSKTRNERRRDAIENIFTSFCVVALCLLVVTLLCGMACKAWEHPAEQPVDGREYIEMVQSWGQNK